MANLARIRDNQRRSRARRKEYLQELETKYRTCEAVGVEASAEIQAAARRVLDENRRLRQLLKHHGISDVDIDAFSPSPTSPDSSLNQDFSDMSDFPVPSNTLDTLLATRRVCKPDSACGRDDGSTRQGCSSSTTTPTTILPQPSQTPIPFPPTQPLQRQWTINPAPQQSPLNRPSSTMSNTPETNQQYSVQPTPPQTNDSFPVYDPQTTAAYMYPMPMHTIPQWDLAVAQQQPAVTQSHMYMPTTSTSIADPYPGESNSSSCFVAADAIRSFSVHAGPEVEQALGCRDGSECTVDNSVVFDLMDRYSTPRNDRYA